MRASRGRAGGSATSGLSVRERLGSQVLVCDGAMGTMLHAGGVSLDRSLPELNVSHADLVRSIHQAYIAAGVDVIETNTFGASRLRLARFGLADRVVELNRAGVKAAREALSQSGVPSSRVLVAGSVSPATPAGFPQRMPARELRDVFREQIDALYEGGIDLLLFETFGSLAELIVGVSVATSLGSVPVVAQMTFVEDGRTLGGDSPEEIATTLAGLGVAALGANCTLGPQGLLDILVELARWSSLPLTAQPNAGPPTLVDGHFQYAAADPAYFARHAQRYVELGATLVGGCCGTTPAHIEAVATVLAGAEATHPARPHGGLPPRFAATVAIDTRGERADNPLLDRVARHELIVACELPPPVGAEAEQAVADAALLMAAGSQAVIVGPVGSTRAHVSPASIALLVQQRVPQLEVILSATTWEKSLMVLQADLLGTYAFGIRHVLCRTGTPPLHGDYPNAAGVWEIDSLGLIEVLDGLNHGRDYNGIPLGRPTAFVIGARVNPAASDFDHEVMVAKRKLAAGADFLVTPAVYDLDALERLLEEIDLPSGVPLLLGLMPLHDLRHAEYLEHEVPEMVVPKTILARMARAGESGPLLGQEIARELLREARQRVKIGGVVLSSAAGSAAELAALLPSLIA